MRLNWFAIAASLLTAIGCSKGRQAAPAAMAFPPSAVKVEVAHTAPLEDTSEYVATLKSLHSTTVQPQIEGQITQISVKSGDRVKTGAPLFQIDPRRQRAAVSSQEAERELKQANLGYARQQEARAAELFKAGAISQQELEQAQTARKTAEADLQSLDAQVQQQQVQLRYYTVTAPTAGKVGDVPVRVGYQVTTSTALTTIDQNETLEVYVSVPIERAGDLKRGLPIRVLSSDGQQTIAETTVGFIAARVDDQTQSVLVKGTVRNADGALRSGQYVRARIVWKTAPGLVIPVTAVLRLNGQFFAFVAEEANGKLVAKQRPITVGPIVGDDYTVLAGIKENERVIVSGVQKLADNAPITAQP